MSIYDVPVHDTKFFPVSGDMMRQMTTNQKNDTGDSAKNPSDAVYSITLKGEQAMSLAPSLSHDDLVVHPIWCDPDQCLAPDFCEPGDRRLHQRHIGYAKAVEGHGIEITLVKFDTATPAVLVDGVEMGVKELEGLILLLDRARRELIEAGDA